MRKRDTALVSFKPCPRCKGTGDVPCTGREYYQKLSKKWADRLHGKMVTIPFLTSAHPEKWVRVPGLAISHLGRGGWWNARVYVSIDRGLNWGGYHLSPPGSFYDEEHDEIQGRMIYYIDKGYRQCDEVEVLGFENVVPALKEIMLMVN